ncbi:MAG TPA: hypothetical protein VF824_07645 [Thermoanaerobaculia bacterium]|jgi:predicted membrane channel-forming protein YqfA (hemolysin III family)
MADELPWYERETPAQVLRRIKRNAVAAWLAFALFTLFSGDFRRFLALTCSAAVTMISFLWLEEILSILLQPVPQKNARRLIVRTLLRYALVGVALAVTIIIARFDAVGVLLGFSVIVVGIFGEALYSLRRL